MAYRIRRVFARGKDSLRTVPIPIKRKRAIIRFDKMEERWPAETHVPSAEVLAPWSAIGIVPICQEHDAWPLQGQRPMRL